MEHDTHKQAHHNTYQTSEPPITEEVTDILDELSNVLQGLVRYTRLPWLLKHYKRLPVLSLFSFVDSCISIGLMTVIAVITHSPFIFPSLGPTAFLFFFTPTAPSASPRNTLIGHAIGVVAGYASLIVTGLTIAGPALAVGVTWSRVIAAGLSLGLTTSLMVLVRTPHPPAGATTLIVSLGILAQPWQLLLLMVAVGLLTLQAIIINRLAGIPYPLWSLRPTVSSIKQLEEEDAQAQESADSRIRYQVAYDLAQLCPPSLGQEIALTGSAAHGVSDEHSDIEMIFYVNWKWITSETRNLTIKPEHLNERINAIFSSTNPKQSVATCLKLILDTLILVPPPYNVARAITTIQESLRTHTPQ